jgi:hypothetical protein
LHKVNAALVGSRTKAAHVADDSTAEVEHKRVTVELGAGHFTPNFLAGLQVFVLLSCGYNHQFVLGQERFEERVAVFFGVAIGQNDDVGI